jgi:hypothetical protein
MTCEGARGTGMRCGSTREGEGERCGGEAGAGAGEADEEGASEAGLSEEGAREAGLSKEGMSEAGNPQCRRVQQRQRRACGCTKWILYTTVQVQRTAWARSWLGARAPSGWLAVRLGGVIAWSSLLGRLVGTTTVGSWQRYSRVPCPLPSHARVHKQLLEPQAGLAHNDSRPRRQSHRPSLDQPRRLDGQHRPRRGALQEKAEAQQAHAQLRGVRRAQDQGE